MGGGLISISANFWVRRAGKEKSLGKPNPLKNGWTGGGAMICQEVRIYQRIYLRTSLRSRPARPSPNCSSVPTIVHACLFDSQFTPFHTPCSFCAIYSAAITAQRILRTTSTTLCSSDYRPRSWSPVHVRIIDTYQYLVVRLRHTLV